MLSGSKILLELKSKEKDPELPSQKTGLQCRRRIQLAHIALFPTQDSTLVLASFTGKVCWT